MILNSANVSIILLNLPEQGGKDKQYFYWFFEAQQNPDKAPVVLWMTGGPGCSSELALLFENGPCTPNADGTAHVVTVGLYCSTRFLR